MLYKYSKRQAFPPKWTVVFSLSSSAIVTADGEVTIVMDSENEKLVKNYKRGEYAKYFPAIKIELAKYVCCSASS